MTDHNEEYHRVRACAEINRAWSANSICACRAHLELARLHAESISLAFEHFLPGFPPEQENGRALLSMQIMVLQSAYNRT